MGWHNSGRQCHMARDLNSVYTVMWVKGPSAGETDAVMVDGMLNAFTQALARGSNAGPPPPPPNPPNPTPPPPHPAPHPHLPPPPPHRKTPSPTPPPPP